jgi:hypothetical protein
MARKSIDNFLESQYPYESCPIKQALINKAKASSKEKIMKYLQYLGVCSESELNLILNTSKAKGTVENVRPAEIPY